jgi:hypothetical protein
MTFFRSLAVLTAVCLCVGFAFFTGYAIAVKSTGPLIYGTILLLAGAAIMVFLNRRDRKQDPGRLERQGWV